MESDKVIQSNSETKPFRILSIDGGGYRGLFAAYLLKRIEEQYNVDWRSYFDLFAGTSTGAIIAAGLAAGKTAHEIAEFYEQYGPEIFPRKVWRIWPFTLFVELFKSKYKLSSLKSLLENVLGQKTFGDIENIPLLICATNITKGNPVVFKSHYKKGNRDYKIRLSDAVLASCAAPTFFDPAEIGSTLYTDGGLWANSPILAAYIEATTYLHKPQSSLKFLSMGTGIQNYFYPHNVSCLRKKTGWGFLTRWQREKFISFMLSLQVESAWNIVKRLVKEDQITRLDFQKDGVLALDDPRDCKDLKSRADQEFSDKHKTIEKFFK